MRREVCDDVRMSKLLTLVLCLTASAACSRDARWERSRAEYCQELELLSNRVQSDLEGLVGALELQKVEPQADGRQCGIINRDLRVAAARVEGFRAAQRVLAAARPENQTLEQSGFGARLDLSAFQGYDAEACLSGRAAEAAAKVAEIKQTMAADFQVGLASCRAVGWKSSLAK